MAELHLQPGFVAKIDDIDIDKALLGRWWAARRRGSLYVVGRIGKRWAKTGRGRAGPLVYLHRFLLEPPDDCDVDHISGDGLDCRRSNMRVILHAENTWNRRHGELELGASNDATGKWRSTICYHGARLYLGAYDTREDALIARDWVSLRLRGRVGTISQPVDQILAFDPRRLPGIAWNFLRRLDLI